MTLTREEKEDHVVFAVRYSLSRLCALTGGIYFALHPNRNAGGNPNPPATPRDDEKKVLPQPKPQRKFEKI